MKKPEPLVRADSPEWQSAGEAIVDAVEAQLWDDNPPEPRHTLQRLMDMGETTENAMRCIACALSAEIFEVSKNQTPYDEARYLRFPQALPELPDD